MELIQHIETKTYEGKFTTAIEGDYPRSWRIDVKSRNGTKTFRITYIDVPMGYSFTTVKDMILDTIEGDDFESVIAIHLGDIN